MDFENPPHFKQSQVLEFYRNKSIFITGATGFVGKAVLEKLLRTCPNVECIYILLRPKKNFTIEERVDKLLNSSIFEKLRKSNPTFSQKIIPISGDVTFPDLGLSNDDQALLQQKVQVVFHSAACVKFNEFIKTAMDINFHGARKVLELCKKIMHLEAFVHVSTAYTNSERDDIEEIVYPFASKRDIEKLLSELDSMDDETAEKMTKRIIGKKPNTYVFTKALVENYLDIHKDYVPITIVRPSIVTATINEPVEGWVDNLNASSGLMVFVGKGLVRSILIDENKHSDLIPVDYLANLIIVAAWNCPRLKQESEMGKQTNEITVYNGCAHNPLLYSDCIRFSLRAMHNNPFDDAVWCPTMMHTKSPLLQWLQDLIYHRIPAYCMDLVPSNKSKTTKMNMTQLYNKIQASSSALEFFWTHGWKFDTMNVQNLHSALPPQDQIMFPLFVGNVDWEQYLNKYILGLRRYTLKEQDSNLEIARQNMKRRRIRRSFRKQRTYRYAKSKKKKCCDIS